jgi:hypothetical protein
VPNEEIFEHPVCDICHRFRGSEQPAPSIDVEALADPVKPYVMDQLHRVEYHDVAQREDDPEEEQGDEYTANDVVHVNSFGEIHLAYLS